MRVLTLAIVILCGAQAALAQYRLEAGDRIKVAVLGAVELSGEVEIDIDGMVRLPVFGSVDARGKTLDELEQALRAAIAGRVFRRPLDDGGAALITVEPGDVYATVVGYRPVYVTGAAGGGVVDFRPGMTVRAAVASAGWASPEAAIAGDPEMASPRLMGDQRRISREVAQAIVELWRLQAELAETPEPEAPDRRAPVTQSVFDALLGNARTRLRVALAATEERREFFEAAIAQAKERRAILMQQQENQGQAVDFDTEEQERVQTLFERGVVPASRLIETRRAQLLSSSRLLDTENNLERVNLEQTRLESDQRLFEDERRTRLLTEIAEVDAALNRAQNQLAVVREELALNGQAIMTMGETQETAVVITVYRGDTAIRDVDPGLALMPGDTVEIAFEIFGPEPVLQ